jgi:hypothetical protein
MVMLGPPDFSLTTSPILKVIFALSGIGTRVPPIDPRLLVFRLRPVLLKAGQRVGAGRASAVSVIRAIITNFLFLRRSANRLDDGLAQHDQGDAVTSWRG